MKYLVLDSGYKFGKDKNPLFATNDRQDAIKAADESGADLLKVETNCLLI